MAGSTISTTITNSVTLGNWRYSSPLTVTSTGEIDVAGVGVNVRASQASGLVVNDGSIISQGIGVNLLAGSLDNAGHVYGRIEGLYLSAGLATNATDGNIRSAKYAVEMKGGSLVNSGSIYGLTAALYGDAGVATNATSGTLEGRGLAVDLSGTTRLTNSGKILVAASTIAPGPNVAVELSGSAYFSNHGDVDGTHAGATLSGDASLSITVVI